MSFLKKHKYKLTAFILIILALIFAFRQGGNSPKPYESESVTSTAEQNSPEPSAMQALEKAEKEETAETEKPDAPNTSDVQSGTPQPKTENAYSAQNASNNDKAAGKDRYQTEPTVQAEQPPDKVQSEAVTDKELSCTLSVRCDTILNNIEKLDAEKLELVPQDGVIFAEQTVVFYEGESVFNLLLREMKKNKIHLEFENTPVYDSAYIEGIGNLYEYDCGELSGWMYKVNGRFPNYGCSKYQLKAGDKVEWVYTCDLGADVGENYAAPEE